MKIVQSITELTWSPPGILPVHVRFPRGVGSRIETADRRPCRIRRIRSTPPLPCRRQARSAAQSTTDRSHRRWLRRWIGFVPHPLTRLRLRLPHLTPRRRVSCSVTTDIIFYKKFNPYLLCPLLQELFLYNPSNAAHILGVHSFPQHEQPDGLAVLSRDPLWTRARVDNIP